MAISSPGACNESAANAARTGLTAADADYNHAATDATDCGGWRKVLLVASRTTGATGQITVQPCVLVGSIWGKLPEVTLDDAEVAIVEVYGRKVYWHVTGVSAGTWSLLVGGAEAMHPDAQQQA